MFLNFDDLPKSEKEYLIKNFGLSEKEEQLMMLKYINEFSYSRIASELHISKHSVGPMLSKARKHMIVIAKALTNLHDTRTQNLITALGWDVLNWPTKTNRKKFKHTDI